MTTTLTITLPLSPLQPSSLSSLSVDYNSGKTQLQTLLAASGSPWQALLPTETGDTLTSLIATIHSSAQQNIIRSFQDAFPNTAVADSAIYAGATMQGVRLARKSPASLSVAIRNSGTIDVSIPAYTQFSGANTFWFNDDSGSGFLFIAAGTTLNATLYQGQVKVVQATGLGTPNQLLASQEIGFSVSDKDTRVSITNASSGTVYLPKYTTGLWATTPASSVGLNPTSLGYVDRTLPNGALLVEFGTGTYGYAPQVSDTVTVSYVVTNGSSANSVNALNKLITAKGYPQTLTVTALANPVGGGDQTPALLYKNIAASSFGTFKSAVTKSQHRVTALTYPGIKDAVVFAEREIQGSDLRWMNLKQVTVLASTPYSSGQQLEPAVQAPAYIKYLEDSCNYSARFYLVEPTANPVTVSGNVYCKPWASLVTAQTSANAAVQALFSKALLNYDVMVTDITQAILNSYSGIDYVDLVSPSADLIVSSPQLPVPTIVVASTGGSISATVNAGVLVYAVGYTTALGVVVYPTNQTFSTLLTGTTNKATVTWSSVSSAVTYQLYGRGAAGWGVIYSGSALTFVDNGSVSIPSSTSSSSLNRKTVQYNRLDSTALSTYYSTRAQGAR